MLGVKKAKIVNTGIVFLAATALSAVYALQIAETNAYRGYTADFLTAGYVLISFFMILGVSIVMPATIRRPSDFFLLFYAIVVLLSCSLFSQVTGILSSIDAAILYLILFVPVMFVVLIRKLGIPINFNGVFADTAVYYFLVFLVLVAMFVGISATSGAGFDWESTYTRRLAGRESIGSRNLTAYLLSMTINGVGPYLAFAGALHKRIVLIVSGLSVGVFAFWLLGLKLPFAMGLIFFGVGYYLRTGRLSRFPTMISAAIALVAALAVLEILVFGYSFLAELTIRRAFVVQGALQSYFFDFVRYSTHGNVSSALFGVDSPGHSSITFVVGSQYLGNAAANANTNAFLYALSSGGIVSFILASVMVGLFFAVADSLYRRSRRADIYFAAGIYAMLITEKAYTTTLVSSGIGLIMVIIFLMRRERVRTAEPRFGTTVGQPF